MSVQPRRILYVPGVRPKPPPDIHRALLRRCVTEGVRRADPEVAAEFAADDELLRPVLWGHLLYDEYRDPTLDQAGIDGLLSDPAPGPDSVREVAGLRHRLHYAAHHAGDSYPRFIHWLATTNTRINLRDSERYFQDENRLGHQVRVLLAAELQRAWHAGERVLLMAHSFGSVIAWDALWQLTHGTEGRPGMPGGPGPVELFLTLGSPLGTRYIRGRLLGAGESGARRFPAGIRRWHNLAARGGLTALGHRFADDFREMQQAGLAETITDQTDLINPFRSPDGLNVHKCYGYFVNAATGAAIAQWWRAG